MDDNREQLQAILKPYRTLVVVGGNWGDEGKGKIIDLVMEYYDVAARFSGGANAGHTVKTPAGVKIVSHLIPCGLAQNKECALGRGELVDLGLFLEELEQAKTALSGKLPKIWLDEQSPVWTPWHGLLESYLEGLKGKVKVGTTGKGIGPLEGLLKLRIAPLVGHIFLAKQQLIEILQPLYQALLPCFESVRGENGSAPEVPGPEAVAEMLLGFAPKVKDMVTDTAYLLSQALGAEKRILFEGAQALGLDCAWGTYPFVSSGTSAAAGAAIGAGLPMQAFNATLMVAKTLPTRVGGGPFPSEMWERQQAMAFAKDRAELFTNKILAAEFLAENLAKINSGTATGAQMSQYFQVLGDERGATTGRGRSVGFMDIPWLRYAIRINGPRWLALTRFDMLSGLNSIPVVIDYKFNGRVLPAAKIPTPWDLPSVEIIKEDWPCWQEDISGVSEEKNLPAAAREFLAKLDKLLGVPILLVGTGPGREAIVVRGTKN